MLKKIGYRKKQAGLSAIETLFVILIATLALIGALALGYKMFGNQQISTEQSNIANLLVNARALKGTAGYGAAATNMIPQMIAIDGIPDTMTVTGALVTNSWTGPVTMVSAVQSFTLTYGGMTQAGCVALGTRVAKSTQFSTRINAAAAIAGEVTTAQATAACTAGSTNSIAWTVP